MKNKAYKKRIKQLFPKGALPEYITNRVPKPGQTPTQNEWLANYASNLHKQEDNQS